MTTKELSIDEKKLLLAATVTQLKQEFIGIDGIIDEISDSILPWWLFPQHQIRPLIINLWGMTGSGKTALIKRMTEILHYHHMLMRFDMGEFGSSSSFLKYTLTRQLTQYSGTAPIILLDEFQFAKTKDETGKEVNNFNLRIIWDLLDSGELIYEPDGVGYYTNRAKKVLSLLIALEKQGVKIKNGIVTHRIPEVSEAFVNYQFGYEDGTLDRLDNKKPFKPEEVFISDVFCTGIHEMNSNNHDNWQEVASKLKEFNSIIQLYDYIAQIYEQETSFKSMDLRKSLIFVVGNLDEAFVMSNNINPDIDADEFQRYTQKITIADIKKALQSRFRNEQIARLGNTHLIYHAFSHKNFEELISMHLDRTNTLTKVKFNLSIKFSPAIHEILYAEGVFPTQGVRPVISTIRNMIESNIAKVVLHHEENGKLADNVKWDFVDDFYIIDFYNKKNKLSQLRLPVLQKINSLRKSTKNDLQALVAVHEAGHAIVSMYTAMVVPEYIITKTVDTDSQGFTYILLPEDIVTYKLLIDKIKIGLGGYVAEQFVFGKDMNTTGVSDDLQKVTVLAQQIIRDFGMHSLPAKHNIHDYGGNPYQFTFTLEQEEQSKLVVKDCLAAAEKCILEHKVEFFEISDYLSEHSRIDKPEIIQISNRYYSKIKKTLPTFLDKETYYNFKNILKTKLSEK
jgi:Peptidase family M41